MRVIGVTPMINDENGRITIAQDYLDSLFRAGVLPLLLPLTDDEAAWRAMIGAVDGLLLSGGADVGPGVYGEEKLPLCGANAPQRDREEMFLCRLALEKGLPVLGICRGHQILNCALGGALYQDVAAQYGDQIKHPCYDVPREQVHGVTVLAGSRLRAITGCSALRVNSRHHQAVKRLGAGLTVSARAEDGLIEGVELPGAAFVLGVQWHPESLSDRCPEAQAIFNAFAAACGQRV